jgi:predicted phosphodiesterase
MILGLIGDIHAEDERLRAALEIFERARVDAVLFVGDVADGPGDIDACCTLLRDAGALGVRGNHDRWLVEGTMRTLPAAHLRENVAPHAITFLESLPAVRDVETPLGRLLLCHGVGTNDMCRLGPDDTGYALETNDDLASLLRSRQHALVVGGHTHSRMVRRFRTADLRIAGDAALWFINPGTLAWDCAPCCAVLDCAQRAVRFFDLDDAPRPAETFALR